MSEREAIEVFDKDRRGVESMKEENGQGLATWTGQDAWSSAFVSAHPPEGSLLFIKTRGEPGRGHQC